jgi:hypothetical protein
MNDSTSTFPSPARFGWIRPRWFLAGLLMGLAALASWGWKISNLDYHPGFVRFHSIISPESNYYPTLDEMCSIVRSDCRPDQILVIVGGNSILLGVWQRDVDVWSIRLQKLLGERYHVVNLAFRGGSPTDGGAVVAESLRREFPRQILIVNEAPVTAVESFGRDPYRYIFWQGYYGGRLIEAPKRDAQIREFFRLNVADRSRLLEARISIGFDQAMHFRDLWNWVEFEYFGTMPFRHAEYFPRFLKPRREYLDPEVDGTDPMYSATRYRPSDLEAEMRIMRGPAIYYTQRPDDQWILAAPTRADLAAHFDDAFPTALKGRTLVLISEGSPYYRQLLAPAEVSMLRQAASDTVDIWQQAGYPAMDYGWDFSPSDFGDRIHLTKTGGWKLAEQVAPKIVSVAKSLGYLQ